MNFGDWSAYFPGTGSEDVSTRAESSRLQSVHHGTVKTEPDGSVFNWWLGRILTKLQKPIGELEFSVESGPAVDVIHCERRKTGFWRNLKTEADGQCAVSMHIIRLNSNNIT